MRAAWVLVVSCAAAACQGQLPGPDLSADASHADSSTADAGRDAPSTPAQDATWTPPPVDTGGADDAATEPDVETPPEFDIRLPASRATLTNDFTAEVSGRTQGRVGAVDLSGNVGTVEIDGRAWPAFGNHRQQWDGFGLTLVQTLVVADGALYPMWLYCSGTTFDGVYYEGTDGTAMTWEPADGGGTCAVTQTASSREVEVPSLAMDFPEPDHRFTVTGDALAIAPQSAGTFESAGTIWQVHPFEVVDCTVDCGASGWWELHAVLWDGAEACFSIFYFFEDRDPQVSYSICLPTLAERPVDQTFQAVWSL